MIYCKTDKYELRQGDMREELSSLIQNSIDCIVTDPPYELNFMGKGWDNAGVSFSKETWEKCLRVLKPGGYLLAFGGSRTFHRIACAIEDAGFEIRDTIMWIYGSGFPKSMDISKQIDKKDSKDFDTRSLLAKHIKDSVNKIGKSKNDLLERFNNSAKVNHWLSFSKSNFYQPTYDEYKILVEEFGCSWEYYIEEACREIIGTKKGCLNNWGGKNNLVDRNITIPSTELAKKWEGWGTALKPAFEPIIVARKPFDGSLVDNVLEYGVGGLNIDECRIGTEEIGGGTTPNLRDVGKKQKEISGIDKLSFGQVTNAERIPYESHIGRYPANLILSYDEDSREEVCGGFPNTVSSGGSGVASIKNNFKNVYGDYSNQKEGAHLGGLGDEGSASRYFYCAKASKRDRDEGLDEFEEKVVSDGRNVPADNAFQRGKTLRHNIHPTVKPQSLMAYLIRLVAPKGATILDPFMGSGSTGKAVMYENKDRNADYKFIGIELTEEYLPVAKARIDFAIKNKKDDNKETKKISHSKEETTEIVTKTGFQKFSFIS